MPWKSSLDPEGYDRVALAIHEEDNRLALGQRRTLSFIRLPVAGHARQSLDFGKGNAQRFT